MIPLLLEPTIIDNTIYRHCVQCTLCVFFMVLHRTVSQRNYHTCPQATLLLKGSARFSNPNSLPVTTSALLLDSRAVWKLTQASPCSLLLPGTPSQLLRLSVKGSGGHKQVWQCSILRGHCDSPTAPYSMKTHSEPIVWVSLAP